MGSRHPYFFGLFLMWCLHSRIYGTWPSLIRSQLQSFNSTIIINEPYFLCVYDSTVFWTGAVSNNIEIKSNTFQLGCCWESAWRAPQQPCEDRKSHWKCQPQNQRVTIHCTTTTRDKNRKLQSVYLPVKDGNKIGFPPRNKLAHHVIFMYQKNGWL